MRLRDRAVRHLIPVSHGARRVFLLRSRRLRLPKRNAFAAECASVALQGQVPTSRKRKSCAMANATGFRPVVLAVNDPHLVGKESSGFP
jgi:hypothetical protein